MGKSMGSQTKTFRVLAGFAVQAEAAIYNFSGTGKGTRPAF
jgi:hypothetical protein